MVKHERFVWQETARPIQPVFLRRQQPQYTAVARMWHGCDEVATVILWRICYFS